MSSPKVSVILNTYNRHDLLPRALDSLETQTYRDFEAIVVDDHSDIPVVIDFSKYSFPIKLYRLRRNSGFHAKPKNFGISKSKAKYICYLDDDDEFLPEHIEALVNAIEGTHSEHTVKFVANPDSTPPFDFAYGKRQYVKVDGTLGNVSNFHSYKPEFAHMGFWLGVPDLMQTRELVYKLGGWNEGIKRFGDFDMAGRMGKIGAKGIGIDKVITRVHNHNGQMTYEPDRQNVKSEEVQQEPVVQKWLDQYSNVVGIFTLSWDRLEYTKRCIEALDKNAGWEYFHLVIDQGSKDGSAEWLWNNYQTDYSKVILLKENIGLPKGINLARKTLNELGFNWFMKLDNDCEILTPKTLQLLMEAHLESPTDLILSPYVKGLAAHKGGVARGLPGVQEQQWFEKKISYTTALGGIFRLYNKRILDRTGWFFDESRPMHYAEDFEFTGKWSKCDFKNGYKEDVFCLHMDGTLGQQEKYPKYFEKHAGKLDPANYSNYVPDF